MQWDGLHCIRSRCLSAGGERFLELWREMRWRFAAHLGPARETGDLCVASPKPQLIFPLLRRCGKILGWSRRGTYSDNDVARVWLCLWRWLWGKKVDGCVCVCETRHWLWRWGEIFTESDTVNQADPGKSSHYVDNRELTNLYLIEKLLELLIKTTMV